MDPTLAKSWMEVLTQGRNWIITAVIVIMLAGTFLSMIVTVLVAWRLGVIERWTQGIHQMEKQNELLEDMVRVIEKCKGPKT